jgi:hypothetical protein
MGAGAKRKSRGLGGTRCNRVTVSLDNQTYNMIKTLSISCDLSISEMIDIMIQDVMQSDKYVNFIQDKFNKRPEYRVRPIKENGKFSW